MLKKYSFTMDPPPTDITEETAANEEEDAAVPPPTESPTMTEDDTEIEAAPVVADIAKEDNPVEDVEPTSTTEQPPADEEPNITAAATTDPIINTTETENASSPPPQVATHPEPPQASPAPKSDDKQQIMSPGGSAVLSPGRIPKKILAPPPTNNIDGASSGSIQLPLVNGVRSNSFDNNGGTLVLPDGVTLPPTVTPQMLEGRLRRAFFELTPAQMREVLVEYDDAVKEKGAEIRNQQAYLFGVVKRYKSIHERSLVNPNSVPQGKDLSDQVKVSFFPPCCYPPIVSIYPHVILQYVLSFPPTISDSSRFSHFEWFLHRRGD